jgi:hypothetical protein
VLDAGEIVEFDEPFALLQRRGQLYDMCRKTGKDMFNHLMNLAKESHLKRSTTSEAEEELEATDIGQQTVNISPHNENSPINQTYGTFADK